MHIQPLAVAGEIVFGRFFSVILWWYHFVLTFGFPPSTGTHIQFTSSLLHSSFSLIGHHRFTEGGTRSTAKDALSGKRKGEEKERERGRKRATSSGARDGGAIGMHCMSSVECTWVSCVQERAALTIYLILWRVGRGDSCSGSSNQRQWQFDRNTAASFHS